MKRAPSFFPSSTGTRKGRGSTPAAQGAAEFLRSNDRLAALLPAVARVAALQKDCAAILPALFEHCSVLRIDAGQLVLAAPSSALATKLKQQLPKLQDGLLKRAWQVSAIRIKVQVRNISEKKLHEKQLALPASALAALTALARDLEEAPANAPLKGALGALLERHRKPG